MNNFYKFLCVIFLACGGVSSGLFAQYATNGTAVSTGPDCFRLTTNTTTQAGSVWNLNQVDISKPFDLYFDIYLGCSNAGADGIAFVLQPISTNVGGTGGGLGYQGISPSIAVEFDTYQNGGAPTNDPVFDHMAIMANGNTSHSSPNNLAGPVSVLPGNGNIEDCNWHSLRVTWDTTNFTMRVYVDCSLRLTYSNNIVANTFSGNPNVFWGFTGATGALTNVQQFCLDYISFTQALQDTAICQGDTVNLNVGSGSTFSWSPTTGLSNATISDPRAFPDTTTTYVATVTDACGNMRFDSLTIKVATPAQLALSLGNDTTLCQGDSLVLDRTRPCVSYLWQNGNTTAMDTVTTAGIYWLELENACGMSRDSIGIDYELPPVVNLGADTLVCNGSPFSLNAAFTSQTPFGTQYLWQDNSAADTLQVAASGLYWVDVSTFCGTTRDSIQVDFGNSPLPFSFGPDTLLCQNDTLILDATQPNVSYRWQDNSSQPTFTVTQTATYFVVVQNGCGTESDTIVATYVPQPVFDIGRDTVLCNGTTMAVVPSGLNLNFTWNYLWNTGDNTPGITINSPGEYILCVTNSCMDVACDTLMVDYLDIPAVYLGEDTMLCPGEVLDLDITHPLATSYRWHDNSNLATFTVSQPGRIIGTVANRCGNESDTMYVSYSGLPVIDLGPDQTLCDGDSVVLDATGTFNQNILWQSGSTDPLFVVNNSGTYWVRVSNDCATVTDSVIMDFEPLPPGVNFGPDQTLCRGESITLTLPSTSNLLYAWSDGSSSSSLNITDAGLYWGEVQNQCGRRRDTIEVTLVDVPYVDLGPDRLQCSGETVVLDATQTGSTYLWQNGATTPTYTVFTTGSYRVEVTNSCGTTSDQISIKYDMPPGNIDLGPDQTLCKGEPIALDATLPESSTAPITYQWRLGETDPILFPEISATYWVSATNRCGVSVDTIKIVLETLPEPDLGPDTLICPNEEIILDATVDGEPSYFWHNGSPRNIFFAKDEGIYTVEVSNTCGTKRDSVRLTLVDCTCSIYLPSAFTPNNDNWNDVFGLSYDCELTNVDFKVLNRWGRTVFATNNPNEAWDGTFKSNQVQEGVYVWVLRYQGIRKKTEIKQTLTGTVTVLR